MESYPSILEIILSTTSSHSFWLDSPTCFSRSDFLMGCTWPSINLLRAVSPFVELGLKNISAGEPHFTFVEKGATVMTGHEYAWQIVGVAKTRTHRSSFGFLIPSGNLSADSLTLQTARGCRGNEQIPAWANALPTLILHRAPQGDLQVRAQAGVLQILRAILYRLLPDLRRLRILLGKLSGDSALVERWQELWKRRPLIDSFCLTTWT